MNNKKSVEFCVTAVRFGHMSNLRGLCFVSTHFQYFFLTLTDAFWPWPVGLTALKKLESRGCYRLKVTRCGNWEERWMHLFELIRPSWFGWCKEYIVGSFVSEFCKDGSLFIHFAQTSHNARWHFERRRFSHNAHRNIGFHPWNIVWISRFGIH